MKTLSCYLAKLIILTSVIFLSCSQKLFAQGNNWKLDGNNNILPKDFIGTKNAADFNIKTNDTLRMKVTKKGNVEVFGLLRVGPNFVSIDGVNDRIMTDDGLLSMVNEWNSWDIKVGIGVYNAFAFDNTGLLRGLEVKGDINLTDANYMISQSDPDNYLGHGYRIKGITVLQTQPIKIYLLV